jgi:hypothetical protein
VFGAAERQAHTSGRHLDAALLGEKIATWPETGLAMLYARAIGAPECRSRATDYYVAIHANDITGGRAVNMGDIVVSPLYDISNEEMIALAGHEARHRSQWVMATVIGGPFAFPVAYAVDDFSSPGHATTSSAKPAWDRADTAMWAMGRYSARPRSPRSARWW